MSNVTILSNEDSFGLGELKIAHPGESFPVTPATRIALQAIGTHQGQLQGRGIDWGCGSGPLSIAAAKIGAVEHVLGLDIEPANVASSLSNADTNGVSGKTQFFLCDSFIPINDADQGVVSDLAGCIDFIIANTPSSQGDDGFEFRRRVLREADPFLTPGSVVLLNVSIQYGRQRIAGLSSANPRLQRKQLLGSTDWVPFDLTRPDLLDCLQAYVEEEKRGGMPYEFRLPNGESEFETAAMALEHYHRTGDSPLTKWQMHLFEYA